MTESSPNLTRVMADGAEDVGGIVEGAGDMDQNYNMENQSITSGSSVEPRSDLSYTDTEPIVTVSVFTVKDDLILFSGIRNEKRFRGLKMKRIRGRGKP